MLDQLFRFDDLAHCQVGVPETPSGSVRLAVIAAPTWGRVHVNETFPSSSSLATMMVTVIVSSIAAGFSKMPSASSLSVTCTTTS